MSATTDLTHKKEKKEKKGKREKKDKDNSSKKRKATAISEIPSEATKGDEISPAPEPVVETSSALLESMEIDATSDVETSEEERPSKKRKASVDVLEVDLSLPEPPSKKALRRLKKGKPLPPPKNGAEDTPEPEEKKKPEAEKRSEFGVWIGNLPWSASKDDLRKFFTENSDITEDIITRIHMPGPNDGKSANKVEERKFGRKVENKGFAYVDFSSAEAVQQAVELSEQLLTGRRVLIKNAKSFEGRPEKTKEEQRNDGKPPSKRIFLGNLTFDTTEESLKDHFEKCGAIESVKVATFEDSGKCKGYAWIVFEELEAAEAAVRGFVRIEEPLSDAEESESEDDSDAGSDTEEKASKSKPKKKQTKTRKWWVNKIKGRPLRMEFAEDAQVRYKKRYGSGGTKNPAGGADGDAGGERPERPERPRFERPVKKVEYRSEYAPRLTGGIVESKGKKTTF